MVEYSLDDLGVPKKTGKNPIEGAKKGNEILNDFSDDNNPVLKYEEEEVKKSLQKHLLISKKIINGSNLILKR